MALRSCCGQVCRKRQFREVLFNSFNRPAAELELLPVIGELLDGLSAGLFRRRRSQQAIYLFAHNAKLFAYPGSQSPAVKMLSWQNHKRLFFLFSITRPIRTTTSAVWGSPAPSNPTTVSPAQVALVLATRGNLADASLTGFSVGDFCIIIIGLVELVAYLKHDARWTEGFQWGDHPIN